MFMFCRIQENLRVKNSNLSFLGVMIFLLRIDISNSWAMVWMYSAF